MQNNAEQAFLRERLALASRNDGREDSRCSLLMRVHKSIQSPTKGCNSKDDESMQVKVKGQRLKFETETGTCFYFPCRSCRRCASRLPMERGRWQSLL
jgi:hypothetical protein